MSVAVLTCVSEDAALDAGWLLQDAEDRLALLAPPTRPAGRGLADDAVAVGGRVRAAPPARIALQVVGARRREINFGKFEVGVMRAAELAVCESAPRDSNND